MKFVGVYGYWLFDEIKDGKVVFALDRKLKKIVLVNDMTADQLVAVMNSAEAEPTRYEFWYEETEKATEETEEEVNE